MRETVWVRVRVRVGVRVRVRARNQVPATPCAEPAEESAGGEGALPGRCSSAGPGTGAA